MIQEIEFAKQLMLKIECSNYRMNLIINSFQEELIHLDKASRVSLESVQKTLKQMDSAIKNLETDLKNSARTVQDKDDKFEECMGSFAKDARDQYSILQVNLRQTRDVLRP